MPIYSGVEVNTDKLEAYSTKDLDYKTQARDIVCEKLGYSPPIELSVLSELCIRNALKRFNKGEFSRETLDKKIDFQTHVIKTVMLEYAQAGKC